ncbi:MAG: hypothetical protein OCC45_13930 [Desulfotalea sp.]
MARKKLADELVDISIEATEMFWGVGAAVTLTFIALTVVAFNYSSNLADRVASSPILNGLLTNMPFTPYVLPGMFALFAIFFAFKTVKEYRRQN